MADRTDHGRHPNAAMREIINVDDNNGLFFTENQETFVHGL